MGSVVEWSQNQIESENQTRNVPYFNGIGHFVFQSRLVTQVPFKVSSREKLQVLTWKKTKFEIIVKVFVLGSFTHSKSHPNFKYPKQ